MKLIFFVLCCIFLFIESSITSFNKSFDETLLVSENQRLVEWESNNKNLEYKDLNGTSDTNDEILASQTNYLEKISINEDKKKIPNQNKTFKGAKKIDKHKVNIHRKTIYIVTKKPSDGSFRTQDQEKARLQNKYDVIISGNDFEHEHIIGVKVLIGNSDEKMHRDKGVGKEFTQAALAYYEIKELNMQELELAR